MQKKKILMQFLIFFCYELSVCPLIFKSDKVYFASSLIAKPNVRLLWNHLILWVLDKCLNLRFFKSFTTMGFTEMLELEVFKVIYYSW